MQSLETIGQLIRRLRTERDLPLRKIAAELDVDASTLSKIERGNRYPSEDLVRRFAEMYELPERDLLIHYYSERIAANLYQKDFCLEILKVAEQKIEYIRQKNLVQKKLF